LVEIGNSQELSIDEQFSDRDECGKSEHRRQQVSPPSTVGFIFSFFFTSHPGLFC